MVKSAPLGRRNGLAELLVRVSKDCRDLLSVAILDLRALQHEDKFAVAQQANRWRRRLIPGEVVPSAIGGFDLRAGKTLVRRSGRTGCCRDSETPGRALPAAHPQTELTTIIKEPDVPFTAASTSAAVRNSSTPARVKS
jgi:hypothetical protein